MSSLDYLVSDPKGEAWTTFIFAHGAGAPMDSDWMNEISEMLTDGGVRVVRFEFPYMVERRVSGKKRPPNPLKVLTEQWRRAFEEHKDDTPAVFIGGKSMGGRVASLVAEELQPAGLICLGYPFHPPGRPMGDRADHLLVIPCPTLIIQGTRDSLGNQKEVEPLHLSQSTDVYWLQDGDHSFKPRKSSGYQLKSHMRTAATEILNFMKRNLQS